MTTLERPEDIEAIAEITTIEPRSSSSHSQGAASCARGVSLSDFYAFMPMHNYIFVPSREPWPASSVDARIPSITVQEADGPTAKIKASVWLDRHRPIEQMTWAPGLPPIIPDRLISDGGWIRRAGVSVFNLYRPPVIEHGETTKAGPWLEHLRRIYPDAADHIVRWLAHRVQRPGEKINHALVLGGDQGIGKDTLLEPIKLAVGPWNFSEVTPQHLLGRFNSFVKSVVLRVSEARDLGDFDRFAFYDHMKTYTAAPPDVLRVDEKNLREYVAPNVCGVIITTNHKTDGIYLPADDRRHFVAWSNKTKDDFDAAYWARLWKWYAAGGEGHVAAYLVNLDISTFDPKAPPPKTTAFWEIVDAHRVPEDAELADALDTMGNPAATTLAAIAASGSSELASWLRDPKNRRRIPHRLEEVGYVAIRNDGATDGLWKIAGKRQAIYARKTMPMRDRVFAATNLMNRVR